MAQDIDYGDELKLDYSLSDSARHHRFRYYILFWGFQLMFTIFMVVLISPTYFSSQGDLSVVLGSHFLSELVYVVCFAVMFYLTLKVPEWQAPKFFSNGILIPLSNRVRPGPQELGKSFVKYDDIKEIMLVYEDSLKSLQNIRIKTKNELYSIELVSTDCVPDKLPIRHLKKVQKHENMLIYESPDFYEYGA